jgi:hypothetical protein
MVPFGHERTDRLAALLVRDRPGRCFARKPLMQAAGTIDAKAVRRTGLSRTAGKRAS